MQLVLAESQRNSAAVIPHNEDIILGRIVLFRELDEILQRLLLYHADIAKVGKLIDIAVLDNESLA